jgi:hypothetical protein
LQDFVSGGKLASMDLGEYLHLKPAGNLVLEPYGDVINEVLQLVDGH